MSGCHAPKEQGTRPLELVVTNDAETLDPRYAVDAVGVRATRLVHAGLFRVDPETLEPVPYVAFSYRFIDPLRLHVDLRPGLRFHSGKELRAVDVVATLRAVADPEVHSRHARIVEPIAKVEPDGDTAVLITLKRPHATLLTDLEIPILRADEARLPPKPGGELDGLGPYTVTSVRFGEVVLAPADTGLLPKPANAVTIRTVHDENARALRLLAGKSDIVQGAFSPALLPALAHEPDVHVTARPGANLTYLVPRVDRPPLDDVEVRRALSLAIDRAGIAEGMLGGYAHPAATLLPDAHWAKADLPALPFDPAAARAVLAQKHVHMTLLTTTDRSRLAVARVVAQELGDAGAEVELVPLELGTMIARLNAGDFDAAILQIPELVEPNVLRVFLHGSYLPPAGSNRGRVQDAQIDALLDEGDSVVDRSARREVYARLEAREREMLFFLPLWHEDQVAVTSLRAASYRPSGEGRWLSVAGLK